MTINKIRESYIYIYLFQIKLFGTLLEISEASHIFLKTSKSEFQVIGV